MVLFQTESLYKRSNLLAIFTIVFNLIEGIVSIWLGASDEALTLFGFGVDSFIEVISAIGIWHMLWRIRLNQGESRDEFEQLALKITGGSFYFLSIGLAVTAAMNIYTNHKPDTTVWGIAVSIISILFMWFLISQKTKVGKALSSSAILADAACSRTCFYLSLVLLAASVGYELTGIGCLDSIGAMFIAWLTWKEGRESFQKGKGKSCECCCHEPNGL
jgi:divalent metal cation (Fe/Co/Zn/Cd) transporter